MKSTMGCTLVSGMLFLGLSGAAGVVAAPAAKGTPNVTKSTATAGTARHPVSLVLMAERLARYGDQRQDPIALIVAARIKQDVGARTIKREKQTRGGEGDASKTPRPDTGVQALVARAKVMAKGRADIVALANEVETMRSRGVVEGSHVTITVIRGGATDTYSLRLEGGVLTVIGISGDGSSDLDLFVEDEHGNRICEADGGSDDEICRFTPRTTGVFKVEVRNLGRIANQYLLVTN